MTSFTSGPVAAWILALTLGLLADVPRPGSQQVAEHQVRAAFVYNFTRFVEWPSASLSTGAFNVCVIGDDRFAASLQGMVQGEAVKGLPIALVEPGADEVRRCQILYVGRAEPTRGRRALAQALGLPVLTVGDSPRFLADGGAVRFLVEDDRVRFDVNLPALERAGISMTSAVLRVARRVEKAGE